MRRSMFIAAVLSASLVAAPSAAQSFEPRSCYEAQFCGVWTARNVVCGGTEPDRLGECIVVRYDVNPDGDVVGQYIGNPGFAFGVLAVGTRAQGCFEAGGSSYTNNNGIYIDGESISPSGAITGVGRIPGFPSNSFFDSVTGVLSEDSLSLTIAGGTAGALVNIVHEFESTFCNQEDCGNCDEPFGDGEPPVPETLLRWRSAEGEFGVASNWDPEQVPTAEEVAVFENAGATSTVRITSAVSRRAQIREGIVEFAGGTYDLVHDSLSQRSLVVGTEDRDLAFLILSGGHELATVHSAIGLPGGDNFSTVEVMGDSSWANQGRLSVGLGTAGELLVHAPDGVVSSGETRIGDAAGGGLSRVEVGSDEPLQDELSSALLLAGNLAVGFQGEGELIIRRDGTLFANEQVAIGDQPGSLGRVTFEPGADSQLDGDVLVGPEGDGVLAVIDSELAIPGDLSVGAESTGFGTVEIFENAVVRADGVLEVGASGEGQVVVRSALLESGSGMLGTGIGGEGNVFLEDLAEWANAGDIVLGAVSLNELGNVVAVDAVGNIVLNDASVRSGEIQVLQASSIQGNGVISANMLRCSGTLDPGIGSGATEVEEFSQKQAQSTSRVLEIEGALELDGGVIDATVGGTNVGELDQVNVIGDATLMGTTIKLRFENGFAATEGDDFPVLTANGALTTEDLLVETEGLDESLDVMLTNEGGVLTLTTTNAADQPRGDVEQSGGSGGGCVAAPSTRVGGASNPENVIGFAALTAAALLIARRRRKVGGARG